EQIGSRERFFDLGLDSLMAIELKQQLEQGLGRTLRATLMFDYPMVEALTDYLLEHLDLNQEQEDAMEAEINQFEAEIASLSEAEAEEMLLKELEKTDF
ncbi:MAG: phosphopantetheine-binding protein, partial [Ardenticatenaceae bacterium]|nr:phosphopantetheine-binding protein [Ardenticatenaceae bacterium]